MTYPNVCLRRGEAPDIRAGQTLIFENELDWADDTCTDGCIVDVLDEQLRFTARGFFNSRSKITVRVLTRDQHELITPDFFRTHIESAWHDRQKLGFENSCRVVFGETDGLPGLTVDKFADYLSFQITCLGLESWKQTIIDILVDLFQPKGVYERDDLPVREKEGLPQIKTCVYGSVPDELEIREHDARMLVSIPNGQKTGHFLDQQENRGRIRPYCKTRPFWTSAAVPAASLSTPRSTAHRTSPPSTSPSRRFPSFAATPRSTAWKTESPPSVKTSSTLPKRGPTSKSSSASSSATLPPSPKAAKRSITPIAATRS